MTAISTKQWHAMPPEQAASLLARDAGQEWSRQFLLQFQRQIGELQLERVMNSWNISAASVARIFGVSRQAVAKWRAHAVPAERAVAMADLAAATDVLERYLRPERIPAVVRRPAELLGGASLLQIAETGDTDQVRRQVAAMFDLRRVSP